MLVNVLKPFPYSEDGITIKHAAPGECEIPDSAVPGLISEGFVDGEGHPEVPMASGRRAVFTERLVAAFRSHLDAAPDAALIEMLDRLDEEQARQAALETKIEPPLETGAPERFEIEELFDVHHTTATGDAVVDKGLTREAAEARAAELQPDEELRGLVRIEAHVAEPAVDKGEADEAVEIPADWRDLHHATQISLAQKLNPADISTKAEAIAAIEAELAKRAG